MPPYVLFMPLHSGLLIPLDDKYIMETLWLTITTLGDLRFWLLVMLFAGIWASMRRATLSAHAKHALKALLMALIIVSLATTAIKVAVNAPRECVPCPAAACNPYCPPDDPYAFPSGHAALSFAMLAALWLSMPCRERVKYSPLLTLPVLVGASRLALGVHTPEQVVAGAAIGILGAVVAWALVKR